MHLSAAGNHTVRSLIIYHRCSSAVLLYQSLNMKQHETEVVRKYPASLRAGSGVPDWGTFAFLEGYI